MLRLLRYIMYLPLACLFASLCTWADDNMGDTVAYRTGLVHDLLVQTCLFDDTGPVQGGLRHRRLHAAYSHDASSNKVSSVSDTVDECPAVTSEDLWQLKAAHTKDLWQLKTAHSEEVASLAAKITEMGAKMDAKMAIILDAIETSEATASKA
jgi:hypothetical protein